MKKYLVKFMGRTVGAIGITYQCEKVVVSDAKNPSVEYLRSLLYDTHEHISIISVWEVDERETIEKDSARIEENLKNLK